MSSRENLDSPQQSGEELLAESGARKPPAAGMGRKAGVPNKVTGSMREMVCAFVEDNRDLAQQCFEQLAKKSPYRALVIWGRLAGLALPRTGQSAPLVAVQVGVQAGGGVQLTGEQAYRLMIAGELPADPQHPAIAASAQPVQIVPDESKEPL